jgi:hypothetical protein
VRRRRNRAGDGSRQVRIGHSSLLNSHLSFRDGTADIRLQ